MGRLGKYELGRTLGEGTFGKVKLARHIESASLFAIKVMEKSRIQQLQVANQVKREITALKALRHRNVVRLHEVLASKSRIYMVLEYVNGDELYNMIANRGKIPESEGRKLFQQIIDAVSYCHNKGVFHRDLKLENVLVDVSGNLKISDFGLSALPEHQRGDGLFHTTCGSPNYVAPEILSNRGYHGAASDVWSCGVMLYAILTGYLPFDDRNLAVLYQKIFKGDIQIPKWLSKGAKHLIRKILEPNPAKRMTMADIKADEWFRQCYNPGECEGDNDDDDDDDTSLYLVQEKPLEDEVSNEKCPTHINAFQLIGMSSGLDLSGLFENEHISSRNMRFTSHHSRVYLLEKIEDISTQMGFQVQKNNRRLKVVQYLHTGPPSCVKSFSVTAEVLEISPALHVVELRKSCGDSSAYRLLFKKLLRSLGDPASEEMLAMDK